jgi:hypothetical protein
MVAALLPAGELAACGAFATPALPHHLDLKNEGERSRAATIPVATAVDRDVLTRGATLRVLARGVFAGPLVKGNLVRVGPVPLAPTLLYLELPAHATDDAAFDAAAKAADAIEMYGSLFGVRQYDRGGFRRRVEAARAARSDAGQWSDVLPATAPFSLRYVLTISSRQEAKEVAAGGAPGAEEVQAVLRRNVLLAREDADQPAGAARRDVLEMELTGKRPGWLDDDPRS